MKKLFAMALVLFFVASVSGSVLAAPVAGSHHKLAHKVKHKGHLPGKSTIPNG